VKPRHRDALNEAMGPGEEWSSLHGCLTNPADDRWQGCPDEISQEVVRRYVITSLGRLFRLIWPEDSNFLQGDIYEMALHTRQQGNQQYLVEVDGVRWEPTPRFLVDQAFVPLEARSPSTTTERRGGLDFVSLDALQAEGDQRR